MLILFHPFTCNNNNTEMFILAEAFWDNLKCHLMRANQKTHPKWMTKKNALHAQNEASVALNTSTLWMFDLFAVVRGKCLISCVVCRKKNKSTTNNWNKRDIHSIISSQANIRKRSGQPFRFNACFTLNIAPRIVWNWNLWETRFMLGLRRLRWCFFYFVIFSGFFLFYSCNLSLSLSVSLIDCSLLSSFFFFGLDTFFSSVRLVRLSQFSSQTHAQTQHRHIHSLSDSQLGK